MTKIIESSYRDPAGSVFLYDKEIFRTINNSYRENYDLLMSSGLYKDLCLKNLIISHSETQEVTISGENIYKIIKPSEIDFISYPSEWTFSQLKAAALLTLKIQRIALDFGLILKDASAYNVQYQGNKPVFIDTLSFEKYIEGSVWKGFRQFCEQFIAPLLIMSQYDHRINMLKQFPDGIPLDIAVKMLPWYKKIKPGIFINITLHSKLQKKHSRSENAAKIVDPKVPLNSLKGHITQLEGVISKIKIQKVARSHWNKYYTSESLHNQYDRIKYQTISSLIREINPGCTYDLGSNTGKYSILASEYSSHVIAIERDIYCAEQLNNELEEKGIHNITTIVADLAEPSPPSGWEAIERMQIWDRKQADLVLALALVHHLAIVQNVPYEKIARLFARFGDNLIVEYVSAGDENAAKMLKYKEVLKDRLGRDAFENAFSQFYTLNNKFEMPGGTRTLYYYQKIK